MSEIITIKLLNIESVDDQLNIHRAAFGEETGSASFRDFWIKKHYQNPLGASLIFGALLDGQIVGMNAYMPVEYYVNGERIKMLQSCESGVLPSCQGKGIWKKVVTYALDYIKKETDYKLVIGFPNYINSYPGFKKMGWKTVCNMKNYVMINNLRAFKDVFRQKTPFLRFALNGIALQQVMCSLYKKREYFIEKSRVEELIWNNTNSGVLSCSHSPELLKWKEDYKELIPVCVKNGEKTVATCLYGLSSYNGSVIIKLECFECIAECARQSKRILASLILYFAKHHKEAAFVRVWAQEDSRMAQLLKKLMFMGSSHPNPFIVNDPGSIYADMPWSLSFFDLD